MTQLYALVHPPGESPEPDPFTRAANEAAETLLEPLGDAIDGYQRLLLSEAFVVAASRGLPPIESICGIAQSIVGDEPQTEVDVVTPNGIQNIDGRDARTMLTHTLLQHIRDSHPEHFECLEDVMKSGATDEAFHVMRHLEWRINRFRPRGGDGGSYGDYPGGEEAEEAE